MDELIDRIREFKNDHHVVFDGTVRDLATGAALWCGSMLGGVEVSPKMLEVCRQFCLENQIVFEGVLKWEPPSMTAMSSNSFSEAPLWRTAMRPKEQDPEFDAYSYLKPGEFWAPDAWRGPSGERPPLFAVITANDVKEGKWIPTKMSPEQAVRMLEHRNPRHETEILPPIDLARAWKHHSDGIGPKIGWWISASDVRSGRWRSATMPKDEALRLLEALPHKAVRIKEL